LPSPLDVDGRDEPGHDGKGASEPHKTA